MPVNYGDLRPETAAFAIDSRPVASDSVPPDDILSTLSRWCERHPRWVVALVMIASTVLTWVPFFPDMNAIYRHWDGPHYVYLAKTLYDVPVDHPFVPYKLTPSYYAAHLPLYPLLIRVMSWLTLGHFLPAMLLATLVSSVAAALLFHAVLERYALVRSPLWTAVLFAFLPPRWVIYHSVGASEPLFLALVFLAFLAYADNRTGLLIAAIVMASLTRIFGVLLVPAFMVSAWLDRRHRQAVLLVFGVLGVAALFAWHYVHYGDALAYFTRNIGESGHVRTTPLLTFRSVVGAGNAHEAEYLLGFYLLYGIGTFAIARHRPLFLYSLAFFALNVFIFHFDISRMFLPIAPFALLVAYDEALSLPHMRSVLALVIAVDYAYAWGMIPNNIVSVKVFDDLLRVLN